MVTVPHKIVRLERCQNTEVSLHVYVGTVKPVYKDHFRDQVNAVSADRWPLNGGASVTPMWTMSQPTMVSIGRWPFYASGL